MTHILQKLRDDVAGMQPIQFINDGPKFLIRDNTLAKIDALLAAQPEPDELVARLRSSRSVWTREGSIPNELETAAADIITSQQAEIRALRRALKWQSQHPEAHPSMVVAALKALTRKDNA